MVEERDEAAMAAARRLVTQIAGAYVAVGVLWIGLSDYVVAHLVPDTSLYGAAQTAKGLAFVGGTGLVLWILLRRFASQARESAAGRERSLAALAESERRAEAVLDTTVAGVVFQDVEGRITAANPAAERILGLTLDQMQGRTSADPRWRAVHEDGSDFPGQTHPSMVALRTGEPVRNVVMGVSRPEVDHPRWLSIDAVPLRRPGAAQAHEVYTTFRDITDLKLAEQDLRESEERFRQALENIPDVVVIYDTDLRIRYINAATLAVTGRPASRYIGRRDEEIWPPEVYGAYLPALEKALATRAATSVDTTIVLPETGERSLTITCVPLLTLEGRVREILGITHDSTEEKRAARALAVEIARRRLLVEQSRDGIVVLDQDGKVYEANRRFADMLGCSLEEVHELHVWDWDTQFGRDQLLEMIRLADATGDHFETRQRRKDGSLVDVEVSTNGAVFGEQKLVFCVCRDITERRRTEAALRRSEEGLREAQRVARLGSWELDLATGSGTWSDQMFRLLAVDPSLGAPSLRDLVESLHPEDRDAVSTSLSRLVDTGEPWSAELRSDPARGPVRHLLANALPVRDRDGRLVRVVGTLQDITERKAAEGERELLIHTVESSLNEIYLFDAGNLRFRFANNGALNNLGCSLAEIQSLTPLDIEPELDDASFRKLIEPLLEGTLPLLVFSTVHRRADGSRYPVEVHLQLFERGGDRVFLAVIQDVSERTLLEGQVRQAQKMEAVGRLAGGVAHDFNNMLGVIFGYTEQLMREWPPQDRRHRLLARILEAAERSADLTRQLLAFSRKQVIRPEIVNIDDVVAGTRSMLQRVIGEDVALIMRLAADAERVRVDPGQITQVLLNLAVNARDAMPHGGTLMLETDTLEIDEERPQSRISPPPGRYVELIVSDDGCGMDADTKAKIFDPFFTTKPAGKGTGLGLATVYGIVRQNDGLIDVESAPGTGSSFRILLPCVDAAPAERLPPRPAVEPGGDETILLVEDQAAALDVLSEMLRDLGYRVLTASQGREALEVAARSPGAIDLLLTDVVMPEMSGRELADRLQEVRPGMAVLYMSGYPVDQISHRGVLDYGVDLIEKPGVFRRATLAARVRAALDARRPTRGPGREAE